MSSKSKPIYEPKNYIPLLENNDKNSAVDYELENQEQNPQTDSCMPALNNKGKLTNFWLCFIIGSMTEMISFLSDVDSFFLWYIIGLSLLLSGLLFFAKISVQIRNINHRKRREIALFFIGGTGLVLFIRLILGWRILAGISSVGTIIIYLFYAKTYVVELDKFIKSNFTFLGFLD